MTNHHVKLLADACAAIARVYSDQSVDQRQTLDSLDELRDLIDDYRQAVQD